MLDIVRKTKRLNWNHGLYILPNGASFAPDNLNNSWIKATDIQSKLHEKQQKMERGDKDISDGYLLSGVKKPENFRQSSLDSGNEQPADSDPKPVGRMGRCRRRICGFICGIRLPTWLTNALLLIYRCVGGAMTYALLFLVVYTTILSVNPSIALPPVCRRIIMPDITVQRPDNTSTLSTPTVSTTIATTTTTTQATSLPFGYMSALQCRRGEALSVILYYSVGFMIGEIMELLRLPGLLGMLIGGMALRNVGSLLIDENVYHELPNGSYPYPADMSDPFSLNRPANATDQPFDLKDARTQMAALLFVNPALSGILRQLALTTILTRAGLGIDPTTLKEVCGSVFRLAFIPCIVEAMALMLASRFIIGWPWAWGAILGFVCAAVSPAVVVPNMMRLEVAGWGVSKGIPTLVVAASSLDDVIAITGFGVALAIALSTGTSLAGTILWGPAEALIGAAFGAGAGVLICLFPPPQLEHSHLIRGLLLVFIAITGLVGSVGLHLPGAGALACLSLAFVIANGWRAGFPWRLTQPTEDVILNTNSAIQLSLEQGKGDGSGVNSMEKSGTSVEVYDPEEVRRKTVELSAIDEDEEIGLTDVRFAAPSKNSRGSISSSILETLVDVHPYCYSALKQQYAPTVNKTTHGGSLHASISSKSSKYTSGERPSLSTSNGTERPDPSLFSGPPTTALNPRRNLRRFSLPEPTAHYELESFSVSSSFRRGLNPLFGLPVARRGSRIRHKLLSPAFRDQHPNIHNLPVDKLEEEEEEADSHDIDIKDPERSRTHSFDDQNQNDAADPNDMSETDIPEVPLPATPKERGLACVCSMRQTMAAIWWFVQPVLFSLIGSEVNLARLRGASTGRGIISFLIALVFRFFGTIAAVLPSNLNMRERLFVACAWLPKATVQAAVGPVALDTARQLHESPVVIGWGEQVVTIAAIAIIISAPLGAILIPLTAPYLLHQDLSVSQVHVSTTKHNGPKSDNPLPQGNQSSSPSAVHLSPPQPNSRTMHSNDIQAYILYVFKFSTMNFEVHSPDEQVLSVDDMNVQLRLARLQIKKLELQLEAKQVMEDYDEAIKKLESEMKPNKPSESNMLEFPSRLNDEDSEDAGDNGEGQKKNNVSDDEGSQLVRDNVGIKLKQNKKKYLTLDNGEPDDDKVASKKVAYAAEDRREAIARQILKDVVEDEGRAAKSMKDAAATFGFAVEENVKDEYDNMDNFTANNFIANSKVTARPNKHIVHKEWAFRQAQDIFQVDFEAFRKGQANEYSEQGECSEDNDEHVQKGCRRPKLDLKLNDRVCEDFDPTDLDRAYHRQADARVCKASVPERFQFRCFPVQRIDSALSNYAEQFQVLSNEAGFIYCSAFKDEPELKSPPVMPEIVKKLKLIRESPFKVSFIAFCRKEYIDKDLSIKDVWTIYWLDEYWTALQHRKRSHALSQKVNDFLESVCARDPGNPMSKHTASLIKQISCTRVAEFNVRLNYLLYYAKFVEPMKVWFKNQRTKELAEGESKGSLENAKEDQDLASLKDAAPVTVNIDLMAGRPSRLRQACATASYEVANRVGIGGLVQRFGLSVTQFAENVQDQYLRYDVDRRPMLPTDTATNFLCPQLPYSSLALAAARHMLAFQISRELFVRRMMRQMFQLQAVMNVRSTAPGTKEINESHQLSAVKYLPNKPVTDLGYVLFLHIHNASRKKLLAYEIHVSNEQIRGLSLNELQQFFHQDQFGWVVQAPNEQRSPILRQAAEEFISTTLIPERHEKMFRD
ncbi:unnamed protein product [Calicophoron daubneyi]|uniref:Uncharacterized protein n=1 Tax=Calicophoron daubneyi TaxID=300641 RepID=A0AAV2TGY3_CALDB